MLQVEGIEEQVKVVASPRNHLYRTRELFVNSPGDGAVLIRVLGQMNHSGDVAHEIDL
jgi:hypothetical protein